MGGAAEGEGVQGEKRQDIFFVVRAERKREAAVTMCFLQGAVSIDC